MNGRETFSTSEHRNLSYLAADTLGSAGNHIGFRRRGGWFVSKTYALLLFLLVLVLMVLAVLLGRCSVTRNDIQQGSVVSIPMNEEKNAETDDGSQPNSDVNNATTKIFEGYNSSLHYVVEPIHYKVYLEPPEETADGNGHFIYSGNVTITLYSKKFITELSLHAKELSIAASGILLENHSLNDTKTDNFGITTGGNENVLINTFDTSSGILSLSFDHALQANKPYDLTIKFSAALHDLPYGMFRFKYSESDIIKYGIATNLDCPFARTVFPCLENYGQKATFELHVGRKSKNEITISNTAIKKTDIINDVHWDYFETTTKIPLERLAFVISDMREQTKSTTKIERFSVWSRDQAQDRVSYALNQGTKLIGFYSEYFNSSIPVQRIDMFALPLFLAHRQEYGRMAIIRESEITIDENTAEENKELVALDLATIIADQWIGISVTFDEQADSWISNALLDLVKYEGVNSIEPNWNVLDDNFQTLMQEATYQFSFYLSVWENGFNKKPFHTTNVQDVLDDMYQLSLPPKKPQVKSNDLSTNKTDAILKTASSMRKGLYLFIMLQNSFTRSLFQSALRQFLIYASSKDVVTASALWNTLSEEIAAKQSSIERKLLPDNTTIDKIIEPWLNQPGIPLVNVTVNYDTNTVTFTQNQLLMDTETNSDSKWIIPVSYTTKNEQNFTDTIPKLWLESRDSFNVTLDKNFNNQTWILVNPQQAGLYRVHYDDNNWKLLQQALHADQLPTRVSAQLLDDALHLSYANILPYASAMDMVKMLTSQNKTEIVIISDTILRHFENIFQLLDTTTAYTVVQSCSYLVLHPIYEKLKAIKEKSHAETVLFAKLYRTLCILDSPICLENSRSTFQEWLAESEPDKNNPIDTNIRYAVVCGVLRSGNQSDWDFVLARYKKTPFSNGDKLELLRALICFNSTSTINKLMNVFGDYSSALELHHIRVMWQTIGTLPRMKEEALSYVIDNWTGIYTKFSIYPALLTDVIINSMKSINKNEDLSKISAFKDKNEETLSKLLVLVSHMEKVIAANIQWRNNNELEIINWMKASLQSSIAPPPAKEIPTTIKPDSTSQKTQQQKPTSADKKNAQKTNKKT